MIVYGSSNEHGVIARTLSEVEGTWQSPGTMFVIAQQIDGWYQEIPTGLKALGMTYWVGWRL